MFLLQNPQLLRHALASLSSIFENDANRNPIQAHARKRLFQILAQIRAIRGAEYGSLAGIDFVGDRSADGKDVGNDAAIVAFRGGVAFL